MKPSCRKLSLVALSIIALLFLVTPSQATTVVMLSDEELIDNSRFIVTGKVRSVASAWDDARSMAWTYVEVRVEHVLKGQLDSQTIVLKQLGGGDALSGVRAYGQPSFSKGQKVLLYLKTASDGTLHVAHSFMGAFSIIGDNETGKEAIARASYEGEVEIQPRPGIASVTDHSPLADYVRKIEERAGRVSVAGADDGDTPVQVIPPEYSRIKSQGQFSPSFTYMAGGVRWMQADSDQPIVYKYNPSGAPVSGGGTAELGRALDAWSAQSGARIRLQLGGQTGSCGQVADNSNTISFGDCLGQLDTPVGCSGVVAQTLIYFFSDTKIINGTSFSRLAEADIVFNKGVDCFLRTSANLAEVACHEIGHSIGLGHSLDTSAMMFATARGNGRDATLGADDKAGVLAVYPASPGGGGGNGGGGNGGGGSGGGSGGGGGDSGGGTVTITNVNLKDAVEGKSYRHQMTASGGTAPYKWRFVGGQMPPGLRLSQDGIVDGTPTKAGSYTLSVIVSDSSGDFRNQDGQNMFLNVRSENSGPALFPVVTRVKVKGSKKLFVYGENFSSQSVVLINGILLTPRSFEPDGGSGKLFIKKKLDLGPAGTNQVVVINSNNRSTPVYF